MNNKMKAALAAGAGILGVNLYNFTDVNVSETGKKVIRQIIAPAEPLPVERVSDIEPISANTIDAVKGEVGISIFIDGEQAKRYIVTFKERELLLKNPDKKVVGKDQMVDQALYIHEIECIEEYEPDNEGIEQCIESYKGE